MPLTVTASHLLPVSGFLFPKENSPLSSAGTHFLHFLLEMSGEKCLILFTQGAQGITEITKIGKGL